MSILKRSYATAGFVNVEYIRQLAKKYRHNDDDNDDDNDSDTETQVMSDDNDNNSDDDTPEYTIDYIANDRILKGKKQFQVIWKNFPITDATWEPLDNIKDTIAFQQYQLNHVSNPIKFQSRIQDILDGVINNIGRSTQTPFIRRCVNTPDHIHHKVMSLHSNHQGVCECCQQTHPLRYFAIGIGKMGIDCAIRIDALKAFHRGHGSLDQVHSSIDPSERTNLIKNGWKPHH